jgi:hypothetical protein
MWLFDQTLVFVLPFISLTFFLAPPLPLLGTTVINSACAQNHSLDNIEHVPAGYCPALPCMYAVHVEVAACHASQLPTKTPLDILVGYLFAITVLAVNGNPGPIALHYTTDITYGVYAIPCFTLSRSIIRYQYIYIYTVYIYIYIYIYISAPLIQVAPPGYFTHISITTPIVSALKNYYR